jgi:hypothetical protein
LTVCIESLLRINSNLPLEDVFRQMGETGVRACSLAHPGKDDPSFFFLRSSAVVRAFDKELRAVTSRLSPEKL